MHTKHTEKQGKAAGQSFRKLRLTAKRYYKEYCGKTDVEGLSEADVDNMINERFAKCVEDKVAEMEKAEMMINV